MFVSCDGSLGQIVSPLSLSENFRAILFMPLHLFFFGFPFFAFLALLGLQQLVCRTF